MRQRRGNCPLARVQRVGYPPRAVERLRIAILGTRGLPPLYGGRETATDEIGRRLAARGHDVVVYCRTYNTPPPRPAHYHGLRLHHLPSLRRKNLDTLVHIVLSAMHVVLREPAPVVLLSGSGTSLVIPWLHLFGRRTVLWVDGKAWERRKWGRFARWYLQRSARFGVRVSDAIVTDTEVAHEFYVREMGRDTACIPYGANIERVEARDALERFGLLPRDYILFVGRLVPEKGVPFLMEAFRGLPTRRKLVIVGDDPYDRAYVDGLKRAADPRTVFTGYVFGEGFKQLMQHCRVYVQPSDVEGTSPVLLTAMALGRPVIVNGIPENRATIAQAGLAFPPGDVAALRSLLAEVLEDEPRLCALGEAALERVRAHYDWEGIADQFEVLFRSLSSR
jgi:glycosyltransferase involved in cell wall biosynthesis